MMAIYRNERFLFDDPQDKCAINRTTRYRKRKRRQGQIAAEEFEPESPPSHSSQDITESYEHEDLGSCGDNISLSVDPQSEDNCASFLIDDVCQGANDCYYVQDGDNVLM